MKELKLLVEFEEKLGLASTQACQVLGIAYSTYAAYRNCGRPLQHYHRNHIEVIGLLPRRVLAQLINERINGQTN